MIYRPEVAAHKSNKMLSWQGFYFNPALGLDVNKFIWKEIKLKKKPTK